MNLPPPGRAYDRINEEQTRRAIEAEDARNHKKGGTLEIGNGKLILKAPDGGRWSVIVDNAGALSTEAA